MKIRTNFVSNSSSTSFVIALAKPISKLCIEDIRDKFGVTLDQAETIHDSITESKEFTLDEILDDASDRYIDGEPRSDIIDSNWLRQVNYRREVARQFVEQHPNHYFYIIEYCDECGEYYSELEHGDHFYHDDVLRMSNH